MISPSAIDARLCGTKGWSVVQLSYGAIASAYLATICCIAIIYITTALVIPIITVRMWPKSRSSKIFRKNIWYILLSPFIIMARTIINTYYLLLNLALILKYIFIRYLEAAMGRKMYKRVRWYGYFGHYSKEKSRSADTQTHPERKKSS